MKNNLRQAILTALRAKADHSRASSLLRDLIKDHLDAKQMLTSTLVEEIVSYLVQQHPCTIVRNKHGRVSRFENLEGATENHATAASNFYKRYIAQFDPAKRDARGGANKTEPKVTPRKTKRVSEMLVLFNDLSAAERAAFLAAAK